MTLLVAACGVRPTGVLQGGSAPTIASHEMTLYFVSPDGTLVRRTRVVTGSYDLTMPMQALLAGPDEAEAAEGLTTEVPYSESTVSVRDSTVVLPFDSRVLSRTALEQLRCTAQQVKLTVPGTKIVSDCPG